jgi:hypothetical protein
MKGSLPSDSYFKSLDERLFYDVLKKVWSSNSISVAAALSIPILSWWFIYHVHSAIEDYRQIKETLNALAVHLIDNSCVYWKLSIISLFSDNKVKSSLSYQMCQDYFKCLISCSLMLSSKPRKIYGKILHCITCKIKRGEYSEELKKLDTVSPFVISSNILNSLTYRIHKK